MKKSIRRSFFLLLVVSLVTAGGFAQGTDPQPPPPHKAPVIGDNPPSVVLDGTLVLYNFQASTDSRVGFVRNVAQALLQTDQISVVYRVEAGAPNVSKLSDGDMAVGQVRYHKLAFDSVGESFFDGMKDFILTDGKRYFRILLGQPEPKISSNSGRSVEEK